MAGAGNRIPVSRAVTELRSLSRECPHASPRRRICDAETSDRVSGMAWTENRIGHDPGAAVRGGRIASAWSEHLKWGLAVTGK